MFRSRPRHQRPGHGHRRRRPPVMTDRDQLAGFATAVAGKVAPIAAAGDEGRVNRRLIRALADEGLLPGLFPGRAGGTREASMAAVNLCVVRESLRPASNLAENA